jgi:hypothetical protein
VDWEHSESKSGARTGAGTTNSRGRRLRLRLVGSKFQIDRNFLSAKVNASPVDMGRRPITQAEDSRLVPFLQLKDGEAQQRHPQRPLPQVLGVPNQDLVRPGKTQQPMDSCSQQPAASRASYSPKQAPPQKRRGFVAAGRQRTGH